MANPPPDDESGILVYPRMPVPANLRSDASPRRSRPGRWRRVGIAAAVAGGAALGGAGTWLVQPRIAPDPRIAAATRRAADAEQAAGAQKQRADALERSLDTTAAAKRAVDGKLGAAEAAQAELTRRTAAEAARREAGAAAQTRLRAALDKGVGTVELDGDELRIAIAERTVWKPADDALTDRGKAVLQRLAAALAELPDRAIAVRAFVDEPAAARAAAAPRKAAKGAPVAAPPRFTTAWELAAARALAVVHFFDEAAKLPPGRLAAIAAGPPPAAKDRAASHRLELVISPRP
jgi:flagellar motor protein MotB